MRILGINDEVTTCECCGRTGLKRTVVLTNGETEVRYGTECAARALRCKATEVNRQAKDAQEVRNRELSWRLENHPLMAARREEIARANASRMPFSARPRERWASMEATARLEVYGR